MKYICSGNIMLDTLVNEDGSRGDTHIGGPSIFAYSGVKLWDDDCLLLTNVGANFKEWYGEWMEHVGASWDGIETLTDFCTHHFLTYHEDGTYDWAYEVGLWKGAVNMGYLETKVSQMEAACGPDSWLYYPYSAGQKQFWKNLFAAKARTGFKMMWEISADSCRPENMEHIREICAGVEMFSINGPEAKNLFGTDNEEEIVAGVKTLPVDFSILRVGKRGMYAIEGDNHYFIDSVILREDGDATGCGNCSTAAAMYAYDKYRDPIVAGVMANISAGFNAMDFGPVDATPENRAKAEKMRDELVAEYRKKYGLAAAK